MTRANVLAYLKQQVLTSLCMLSYRWIIVLNLILIYPNSDDPVIPKTMNPAVVMRDYLTFFLMTKYLELLPANGRSPLTHAVN